MHKHLHALILPEVVVQVLVHGFRLTLAQVVHGETQRLLVVLHELRLRGVGGAVDARGQGVGHGLAVGVLFYVDSAHHHGARLGALGRLQALLILAPLAAHEVERTEAQHNGLLKARHIHAHEADRGEVVDTAHLLFILGQGYAELIPADGGRVAVAQLHP